MATLQTYVTERLPAESVLHEQRLLSRIGSVCAIVGTLLLVVSLGLHGDLPLDVSTETALRYIVQHPSWLPVHLGMMTAALLWVGAFVALAGSLATGAARALGRLLVVSAALGGAFSIFNYSVDGYAFGILATDWASTASAAERAALQERVEAAVWFLNGTFRAEISLFYGLTFLLAGLAVALDGRYRRAFGAVGAAAGAVVLLVGTSSFAGLNLIQDWLVFAVIMPIEGIWLLALGVQMWRRGGRVRAAQVQPRA